MQSLSHSSANVGDLVSARAKHAVDDNAEVLIECCDVYKSFGEKPILQGASFKVNQRLLLYITEFCIGTIMVTSSTVVNALLHLIVDTILTAH